MAAGRLLCCIAIAFGLLSTTAQAAGVLVLQDGGGTLRREEPGVAARDLTAPTHLRERRSLVRARASASKRTVVGELDRLLAAGQIDQATHDQRRADYLAFRGAVGKFSGQRRTDMAGV